MHSQRWMFMSPGGENEYKKPSVTRAHYDAVVEAKKAQEENHIETESGEFQIFMMETDNRDKNFENSNLIVW